MRNWKKKLIVRPTSETIIWNQYKNWIQSYRDLPLLINQWANVVRWEMRTRLFLRTAEFLWQEGHTAHATAQEAIEETEKMLTVYAEFAEEYLALPVIRGKKTPNERFAGAVDTYCIEAMMQDGQALQAGTSHFLGQNFAKAFDVQFLTKEGKQEYVWATSWGVSTRLVGALIMAHSDDDGLVLPPKLAPLHVAIVPIHKGEEELNKLRTVEVARRDTKTKGTVPFAGIADHITALLDEIQQNMYNKALAFRDSHIRKADTWEEFLKLIEEPGFISAHWDGTSETEDKIKEQTKATIRCIPLDNPQEDGKCVFSGAPSKERILRIQQWAVGLGLIIMLAKFTAYYFTHSNTILTDALESIVNIVAGAFALYSLILSSKPKDTDHPYGHGKIEFIATGFEGILIILASILIIWKSILSALHPEDIHHLELGLILVTLSGIANYLIGHYLELKSKEYNARILDADGKHLKADGYISLAILLGIAVIWITGIKWLDNVFAIAAGLFISYTGIRLVRKSLSGIMDEADAEIVTSIVAYLNVHRQTAWIDIHNMRVIQYGSTLHVDCHVTLPWYYTLEQTHQEIDHVEKLINDSKNTNWKNWPPTPKGA
ncbi:unnamed protein product [Sphagnum jensenii]|uniref:Aminoacyl-transfer RNA synthetases class-II family profile domain-containing protein n=1 Tax=Sphagnum jensenii TaxID=128206 RepID=A0ABP0VBI2_9BRYO